MNINLAPANIEAESLKLAYESAMRTYDWAMRRIEFWDGHLERLLIWGGPFSFALIGRVAVTQLPFGNRVTLASAFFWLALMISITAAANAVRLGLRAKRTNIVLIGPKALLEEWLELGGAAYRHHSIEYAAQHFEKNLALIEDKAITSRQIVRLFITSATSAAIAWVVGF